LITIEVSEDGSSDPVTQWCYAIFICAVRGVALSTSGNAWVVPRDHRSGHASSDTFSVVHIKSY
jgi:hypothetical protein